MRNRRLTALLLAGTAALALVQQPSVGMAAAVRVAQQDTLASRGKKEKKKKAAENGTRPDSPSQRSAGDSAKGPKSKTRAPGDRSKVIKDSIEAEGRALFASRAVLPFTLIANFDAIARNRDSTSTTSYAGTLVVPDSAGAERRIPVQLRTRGHYRLLRSTCKFVNLLVRFPDKGAATDGTPFAGQKSLKLGSHCQDDRRYDQLLRREYLAYSILRTVTPHGFRARLATGTYIDSAKSRTIGPRVAMWIESENDMAKRQAGQLRDFRRALFDDMDATTLDQMAIFEYLIGNTDWSIYALHNVRIVVTDSSGVYPIPYDFDFSGLVNAPYAIPAPQLRIRTVRDRLFRGPCRPWEWIAPTISKFAGLRREIMARVAEVPDLEGNEARDINDYLSAFFEVVDDPRQAKEVFVGGCLKQPGA